MVIQEQTFPRGGSLDINAKSSTASTTIFGQTEKKKNKSKKKTIKHHVVTGTAPKVTFVEDLSFKTYTEGMLVLGRIQGITEYHLHVALPGLVIGKVPITHVSEPYSKLLQAMSQNDDLDQELCPLSEIFYKEQLVTAYVWQKQAAANGRTNISLSLDPRTIYANWSHDAMAKVGLIITAAVRSKEEHGYVMDCGVTGLRCFLKEENALSYCENWCSGRPLGIGQLVRCVVVNAESTSTASKIEVSADPELVGAAEENGCIPVDHQQLIPGMRFKLSVSQPLRDGVKVQFHTFTGYIHHNHLPRDVGEKEGAICDVASQIYGRLLYVMPTIKSVYFSGLPSVVDVVKEPPKPKSSQLHFKIGDIIKKATVIGVGGKGLFLQFGRKEWGVRGFVPLRRCNFRYEESSDDDRDSSMLKRLRSKFPLGDQVHCRLLHYDSMTDIFVCSMEKAVLNEKYLTISNVSIGDVVPCVVDNIRNGGIVVRIGMLEGFVPATHSADIPLQNPSKKYQQGTKVSGRVLKIDAEKYRAIITLKQSLVTSLEPIITSYRSAQKGMCYLGTVVAVREKGVWVSFFGNVRGYLDCAKYLVPEGKKFYEGELVRCYVIQRNESQLRLSLEPIQDTERNEVACQAVQVGHQYTLEVTRVTRSGLDVRVVESSDAGNASGKIPVLHMCDDARLTHKLLKTFEIGTRLNNVWCYISDSQQGSIIFSMLSAVKTFFKSSEWKVACKKSWEAVEPGWILPCCIEKIQPNGVFLYVPLPQVNEFVFVKKENLCNDPLENIEKLGFSKGQVIQAKILKVDKFEKLILGCKLTQVWNGGLKTCVKYLSKYLQDQRRLLAHAARCGNPVGAYRTGTEAVGIVRERTEWGYIIDLDNGARGEVTMFNSQEGNCELGNRVFGKVLYVDCLRQHVEVTLRPKICSVLKETHNNLSLEPNTPLRGRTLLVTPEFNIVLLKGAGRNRLGFMPAQPYPNLAVPLTISEPYFGIDRKVVIKRDSNGIIVCVPKELDRISQQRAKHKARLAKKKSEHKAPMSVTDRKRYFVDLIAPEDIKKEAEEPKTEDEEASDSVYSDTDSEIHDGDDEISSADEVFEDENEKEVEEANLLDVIKGSSVSDTPVQTSKEKKSDAVNSSENETLLPVKRKCKEDSSFDIDLPEKRRKSCNESLLQTFDSHAEFTVKKNKREKTMPMRKGVSEVSVDQSKVNGNKKQKCNAVCVEGTEEDIEVVYSSKPEERKRKFCDGDIEVVYSSKPQEGKKKKTKAKAVESNYPNEVKILEQEIKSESEMDEDSPLKPPRPVELKLKSPGFVWNIDQSNFARYIEPTKSDSSSDDDSEDGKSKKKKQRKTAAEKKEAAWLEEDRLRNIETQQMDPNYQPRSCDDFDKKVLAYPNSSTIWLQYMAFHLQATEIEKARAVAQRAIRTISYREEQEKLNVWLGLLNLENLYGSAKTLKNTLEQALHTNDPYMIRAQMVRIYAESGKSNELENEVRLVVKKFKNTPGMWQEISTTLMKHGHADHARTLLQQALPHMKNKQESVALIIQFALLEARYDNIERAKALLDPVLTTYPQRVDVWTTYADMLIKAKNIDEARELLERGVNQKLPARKMKTLFTKFLQLEEIYGTPEGQERVKKMAVNFVNNIAGNVTVDD